MPTCPLCVDGNLAYLGTLGNLIWFRCIHCGAEVNTTEIPDFDPDGLLDIVDDAEVN
jgi:hypothetical protein